MPLMPFRKRNPVQFKPGDLVWVKNLTTVKPSIHSSLPYGIRARHPHHGAHPHSYPKLGVIVKHAMGPSGVTYYQVLIGTELEWASPYDIDMCSSSTEQSGLTHLQAQPAHTHLAVHTSHPSRTGTYTQDSSETRRSTLVPANPRYKRVLA